MAVLVTGGAGYLGTHTVVELKKRGEDVVIVDNYSNSKPAAIKAVEKIIGEKLKVYEVDVADREKLCSVFKRENIDSIIHFAGYKAVGESVAEPVKYYKNNVCGTISVIEAMKEFNVKNIVFSSTATVYGIPKSIPVTENAELNPISPYAKTKYFVEQILGDLYASNNNFNIGLLRYFNPIGAHESGMIGENPNGIPNNLMPYITQVAVGKLSKLKIFGNDYNTADGTGVRDYIHVTDLAYGHTLALDKLKKGSGLVVYNLGTGKGTSVLQLVNAFERATGAAIPYEFTTRRAGDIDEYYASCDKAMAELDFKAEYSIEKMCEDSWRWQKNNPNGFR